MFDDAYKIVMCLIMMSRCNERHLQKYHSRAIRDQQKLALTRAASVPSVHIGADGVGSIQQCMCYSFYFHTNVIAFLNTQLEEHYKFFMKASLNTNHLTNSIYSLDSFLCICLQVFIILSILLTVTFVYQFFPRAI